MTTQDKQWFDERFGSVEQKIQDSETKILAFVHQEIEASETKLLTAFYKWAEPVDIKLRSIPALEARLQLLEERVRDLEIGRKPPQ